MTAADIATALHLPRHEGAGLLPEELRRRIARVAFYTACVLLSAAAVVVIVAPPYQAGDAVGYNMGLAGGVMMLTLLLYPLRKRLRSWNRLGGMRNWFGAHMATGILGPLLVLFHSTFRIGSMNARVALYATLIVFASGIVGRFVYRHIHRGLYGSKLTVAELEQDMDSATADVDGELGRMPGLIERLRDFERYAAMDMPSARARLWRFVNLRRHGHAVARDAWRHAEAVLKHDARAGLWPDDELLEKLKQARRMIDGYVGSVCAAAQFTVWESLFSLWHVLHVPLVYLLVLCGVAHVVAVHMY
jgi:hypothetical protein